MARLPMSKVRKDVKKYSEKVEIPFDIDGEEYEVIFKPFFSNEGIKEIINELKTSLPKFDEHKLNLTDDLLFPYIAYVTVKVFSDLITPNIKDYKTEENYYKADIQYFTDLYNGGYIKTISEYFVQSEWEKVQEAITNILIINERIERDLEKYQQQIKNLDLQSPELKNRLKPKQIPEV